MDEPTPINLFEAARRWTVATLRRVAEELETAPHANAADALLRLGSAVQDIDHTAQLCLRPLRAG